MLREFLFVCLSRALKVVKAAGRFLFVHGPDPREDPKSRSPNLGPYLEGSWAVISGVASKVTYSYKL